MFPEFNKITIGTRIMLAIDYKFTAKQSQHRAMPEAIGTVKFV
ncbi:MAG: hypothetical protein ACRC62_11600 [Microcoleus sp.]